MRHSVPGWHRAGQSSPGPTRSPCPPPQTRRCRPQGLGAHSTQHGAARSSTQEPPLTPPQPCADGWTCWLPVGAGNGLNHPMDAPPSSAEVRVCVGRSGEREAGNLPCVPAGGQQVVTSLTRTRLGLGGSTGRCGVPRAPPFILAAPRPCSQLNLMPKGPHPAKGQGPGPWSCLPVRSASWGSVCHPEAALPVGTGAGAARGPAASVWSAPGQRHSPCEEQAQQGAEEDEDLVEHGRLRPQDGPVEVILWDMARHRHSPHALEPGALPTTGVCQMYMRIMRGEGRHLCRHGGGE